MKNSVFTSLVFYESQNTQEANNAKYSKIIDSINGEIEIVNRYDADYGAYRDVYLNGKYICFIGTDETDSEIEDIVENNLFNADNNDNLPI